MWFGRWGETASHGLEGCPSENTAPWPQIACTYVINSTTDARTVLAVQTNQKPLERKKPSHTSWDSPVPGVDEKRGRETHLLTLVIL